MGTTGRCGLSEGTHRSTDRVPAQDRALLDRLHDQRSRQVVFLSHWLLNENTRYLGGACRAGCVPELVQQCVVENLGIVQLPCPEQHAWGGVLKHRLLLAFGLKEQHPSLYRLRRPLLSLALRYTRLVYRQMAAAVARQVADYVASGFVVRAVVGVDGSPSCGVSTTLDTHDVDELLSLPAAAMTASWLNGWVRHQATPGTGMFIAELQTQLTHRRLAVPFLAHDLLAELDGQPTTVDLNSG